VPAARSQLKPNPLCGNGLPVGHVLLGFISVSANVPQTTLGGAALLDHYAQALRACHATVAATDEQLVYTVSMREPQRLSLRTPDLGMVARGSLDITEENGRLRVTMRVHPRSWFIILAVLPWLSLAWALGVGSAPWHYLLALGGLPLVGLLWLIVWSNVHTFLDHAHADLPPVASSAVPLPHN
jgi:hypothetical protein